MKLRAVFTIAFAFFAALPIARAVECKSTAGGDLRIHPLVSDIFNNTRSIRVLLPPGYVYEQGAKHTESAWAKRLPDALKFMFGDWKPQPEAPDAGKQ